MKEFDLWLEVYLCIYVFFFFLVILREKFCRILIVVTPAYGGYDEQPLVGAWSYPRMVNGVPMFYGYFLFTVICFGFQQDNTLVISIFRVTGICFGSQQGNALVVSIFRVTGICFGSQQASVGCRQLSLLTIARHTVRVREAIDQRLRTPGFCFCF